MIAATSSQVLRSLVNRIGTNPAIRLTRAYSGRRLYIPKRMDTDHPIALVVGKNAADELADAYGGDYLAVPDETHVLLGIRNAKIVAEVRAGRDKRKVAEKYGITPRMVRKIWERCAELVPHDHKAG